MLLHEATTLTARDAFETAEVALLPTGATEQHGPALALGMDFLAAEAVARGLDREDCVVLPTVPIGVSGHHRQFHGTLAVSGATFERYVAETLASLAAHGVEKAVVVNGHGGNEDALVRAATRLRREETAFVAPWNWWDGLGDLPGRLFDEAGGHADALETSVLWHLHEEYVSEDALTAAERGASESWGLTVEGTDVGFDAADFTDSGAVGRPTLADPEKGERVFERACTSLDALVDWLVDQELEALWPKPHR
jgi:creatinine amidohydrolase